MKFLGHFVRRLGLWFFIGLSSTSGATSQTLPGFCAAVSPQFGPLGYQKRDEARCEGLYNLNVGAPTLSLLSVTQQERLPPSSSQAVSLRVLGAQPNSDIFLTGQSLVTDINYRLDALLSAAQPSLNFSLDIAKRSGLDLSQVGFVAKQNNVIFPLQVSATSQGTGPVTSLRVVVQSGTLAEHLTWRWENCALPANWRDVAGSVFPPSAPIVITNVEAPPAACLLRVLATANGRAPRSQAWLIGSAGPK